MRVFSCLVSLILMIILDFGWFNITYQRFYSQELPQIFDKVDIAYLPAGLFYILYATAINFFVIET